MSRTHTSKFLSWLLRHGAREEGLRMDEAGWASVHDVLTLAKLTADELDELIRHNDKCRLERSGDRIRASQGHSLEGTPVSLDALEASWEPARDLHTVYHGTRLDAVPAILQAGLEPMRRTHVHMAPTVDSPVGKRANVQVALVISASRLRARGISLFRSPNGVVLARRVPSEAFTDLLLVSRSAQRDGRAMQDLVRARWSREEG